MFHHKFPSISQLIFSLIWNSYSGIKIWRFSVIKHRFSLNPSEAFKIQWHRFCKSEYETVAWKIFLSHFRCMKRKTNAVLNNNSMILIIKQMDLNTKFAVFKVSIFLVLMKHQSFLFNMFVSFTGRFLVPLATQLLCTHLFNF